MSIFARPHYTSEATNFIEQLKKDKPQLDAQQQQSRSLLWDKEVDADVWQDYRAKKWRKRPTCTTPTPRRASAPAPCKAGLAATAFAHRLCRP